LLSTGWKSAVGASDPQASAYPATTGSRAGGRCGWNDAVAWSRACKTGRRDLEGVATAVAYYLENDDFMD
jgi:type IV secretory pathway TrbL component